MKLRPKTAISEYFSDVQDPRIDRRKVHKLTEGEVVAIDGKTLRHSYDTAKDQKAIHMVSAWASKNRLVLGQVKVDKKSNEITAIPSLLKKLKLNQTT